MVKPTIDPETKNWLIDVYREDALNLSELLDMDFTSWLKKQNNGKELLLERLDKNSMSQWNQLSFDIFAYWHDPQWKGFVGATVKIRDLAYNLAYQGHRVRLFLPRYHFAKRGLPFDVIEIPFLDLPLFRSISFNLCLAMHLLFRSDRTRLDVVYLRRTNTIIPRLYAALKNALFFFEVNDDPYRIFEKGTPLRGANRVRQALSILVDNINIRAAHRVFVISDEIADIIMDRNLGLSRQKFVKMPSGANTELFCPMDQQEAITALGLDPNREYVGFVGTLLAHQGVEDLVSAARGIIARRPKCRFLIVGEGPMLDSWREAVHNSGLASVFTFAGAVDYQQVPLWINAMDVCVAPYKQNAGLRSPVKIFDYLACARPVVASRIPGTTNMFEPVEAVRLVEPENPSALAEQLIALLRDEEKRKRIGNAGRQWVVSHYDRAEMAKKVSKQAEMLFSQQSRIPRR